MYHPTDLPSRDTEMADKPVQCDRCNLTEEMAGEFFCCPTCHETLCAVHSVRVSQWGRPYECEPCFLQHEAPAPCPRCKGTGWETRTNNDCVACNGSGNTAAAQYVNRRAR